MPDQLITLDEARAILADPSRDHVLNQTRRLAATVVTLMSNKPLRQGWDEGFDAAVTAIYGKGFTDNDAADA